ncbi:YfhO family protein [Aggregatilineales bacterium SYSU G02658]
MRRGLIIGALAALLLAMFHQLVFTDRILARGDTFNFFYPYWDARHAALRAGELPLWTPELFMGSPLLAEPQVGTFYPPNWPLTPLNAPDAVRVSVLLHVLWAGVGMLWLYRALTGDPRWQPALTAAVAFAFGGYLTARVEQINQLQGLAWLPWCAALWLRVMSAAGWRDRARAALLLMGALAVQFFSGHTQTSFLTGAALGLLWGWWALSGTARRAPTPRWRLGDAARPLLWALIVGAGALLLALPQFLPTLELTGLSNRGGGGFNRDQATAFSLPPHYLGRALLPSHDGLLFTEYLAGVGVIGLGLAAIGAAHGGRGRGAALLLAGAGLFLALGRFNPLYYEALASLPGFNLFRVPARWLALLAVGAALLSGLGVAALIDRAPLRRWLPFVLIGALAGLALLPRWVSALQIQPEDISGGAAVTARTLAAWGIAGAALAGIVWRRWAGGALAALSVELLAASLVMPFNDLAPREVYLQGRFTAHQMQAYAQAAADPPRLLSISALLFDVGDRDRLRARYQAAGLGEEAIQLAFTALKRQEIVAGNLPLTWGVHSADGYGGGLLPTMTYSQLTALLLPTGSLRSVDGRIGEMLARPECRGACWPAWDRLARLGITHLLTDKVYDVWHDGVGYDAQRWPTATAWTAPQSFPAQELRLLVVGQPEVTVSLIGEASSPNLLPRRPQAGQFEGAAKVPSLQERGFRGEAYTPIDETLGVQTYRLTEPLRVEGATVTLSGEVEAVLGMAWVNPSLEAFLPLTPLEAQRALSSDVKLYELAAQRAQIATHPQRFEDSWAGSEDALHALAADPTLSALHLPPGAPPPQPRPPAQVQIAHYEPTRVVLRVRANPTSGYLILRDAYYPGWQATVNGQPAPVYRADVHFRAVYVPAGDVDVVFMFAPALWDGALKAGLVAWAVWAALLAALLRQAVHRSAGR